MVPRFVSIVAVFGMVGKIVGVRELEPQMAAEVTATSTAFDTD